MPFEEVLVDDVGAGRDDGANPIVPGKCEPDERYS
jgi:hypothetical protein